MSHGSARTTLHGRLLIVQRFEAGWPQSHIAAAMGVSRKCVKTWIDRYAAEGEAGLRDRSSRPHRMPTRTSARVEQAIVDLRLQQRRGPEWIGAEAGRAGPDGLAGPGATRYPAAGDAGPDHRAGHPGVEDHRGPLRARPSRLAGAYGRQEARTHPAGRGWRGRNETVANHRSRKDKTTRVGFDYVHSLVDDHSRLAYSEVLPDEQGPTCAAFLDRALDYFAAHGIPKVERLMTDNAWAYRWSLRTTCAARGNIKQVFIRPHCPWQNGKVERLNRTLLTEWAYRQAFTSNDQRTAALAPWLEHYNTERRHSALGGLPPVSRLPT